MLIVKNQTVIDYLQDTTVKTDVISKKLVHCIFIFWVNTLNLTRWKLGTRGNINAIWWTIKVNLQKMVDVCGYELWNLQNFTQKDSTEVKIFQKSFRGATCFETPCMFIIAKTKLSDNGTW